MDGTLITLYSIAGTTSSLSKYKLLIKSKINGLEKHEQLIFDCYQKAYKEITGKDPSEFKLKGEAEIYSGAIKYFENPLDSQRDEKLNSVLFENNKELLRIIDRFKVLLINNGGQEILALFSINTFENTEIIKYDVRELKEVVKQMQETLLNQGNQSTKTLVDNDFNIANSDQDLIKDDEIIFKLGEELISKVDDLIENNELDSVLEILNGLINMKNFKTLDAKMRCGILSSKGRVFIKRFDKNEASLIKDQLEMINIDTKSKWNFIFRYAVFTQNESLVNDSLDKLQELGIEQEEIAVKKTSYYIAVGNYEMVKSILEEENQNEH